MVVGTSELISCWPPLLLHQVRHLGASCPMLISFFYLEILTAEFGNWICLGCWGRVCPAWGVTAQQLGQEWHRVGNVSHLMHNMQLESWISRGWMQWKNIRLKVTHKTVDILRELKLSHRRGRVSLHKPSHGAWAVNLAAQRLFLTRHTLLICAA